MSGDLTDSRDLEADAVTSLEALSGLYRAPR